MLSNVRQLLDTDGTDNPAIEQQDPTPAKECDKPNWWCTGANQTLTASDCDGDGTVDWVCEDAQFGGRGVILSSRGCDPSEPATGWPGAPAELCPQVLSGPACPRPNWWCADPSKQFLHHPDCDGDGTADWVCIDPTSGSRGVLLSSAGCDPDASGWPNAPASLCPSLLTGPACPRPDWWCGDRTKQILQRTDCDGDGTPDWVCTEPATGGRGVLLSTRGCNPAPEESGWPNAPASSCPSVFTAPACSRPDWWCQDNTKQVLQQTDCDGDGLLDWVCTQPATGGRGVLLSSRGCNTTAEESGWPNAAASSCPSVFKSPPCARPDWWCSDALTQLSSAFDCDGDGTADWVCTEPVSGSRGVLLSSAGCDMDHSGWPDAPASLCPGFFVQ